MTSEPTHNVADEADKLVRNNVLTMLARFGGIIASPLLIAAFGVFGWYTSTTAEAIGQARAAIIDNNQSLDAVTNRVNVIETRIDIGQKNRDAQYETIIDTLTDVQKSLVLILQTQAAQNEKFNSLDARMDRAGN